MQTVFNIMLHFYPATFQENKKQRVKTTSILKCVFGFQILKTSSRDHCRNGRPLFCTAWHGPEGLLKYSPLLKLYCFMLPDYRLRFRTAN